MKAIATPLKYLSFGLMHIFFWIGVYFFFTYFLGYGGSNTVYVNSFSAYLMPVTILLSYFVVFYLIPNYLLEKKYNLFALYSLYTLIISFSLIVLSIFYGLVFSSYLKDVNARAITKSLPLIILGIYFVVIVATSISLIVYNYLSSLKNEDLKNRILQSQLQLKEQELKFLKMQIHPHFLFNSLNTIYGYALKKADQAPEMILKLSNLLDYILYQVEKPTVSLQDELHHLKDYISLEEMRFQNSLLVNVNDKTDAKEIQIAPLLLIPFIENSFKHGALVDGQVSVNISVKLTNNTLFFLVENSCKSSEVKGRGIGLENIKKRLSLLYPNAHTLNIEEKTNRFRIELTVETNQLKPLKNAV